VQFSGILLRLQAGLLRGHARNCPFWQKELQDRRRRKRLVDDATLKLLQDYAAGAAERLGLQASVSASNGRAMSVSISKQSAVVRHSFYYSHVYSSHEDAVRFIDRMLQEAGNAS
jgi:hypothetical protein